jgi:hypothetical protein
MFARLRAPVCQCLNINTTPSAISKAALSRPINFLPASKPPATVTPDSSAWVVTASRSDPAEIYENKPNRKFN